jgi:hypothetical protein
MIPEWSPDPRDTVPIDGGERVVVRGAGTGLALAAPTHLPAAGPPAFILFSNFRS